VGCGTTDDITLSHGSWHGVQASGVVSETVYLSLVLSDYG
jgi:hypothetical protein